jgi:hypothetical protein
MDKFIVHGHAENEATGDCHRLDGATMVYSAQVAKLRAQCEALNTVVEETKQRIGWPDYQCDLTNCDICAIGKAIDALEGEKTCDC